MLLSYFFSSGIKYNEEKESKAQWDTKQKELTRIEEAKKREAEKGEYHTYISSC
jgi:hypothetical protein